MFSKAYTYSLPTFNTFLRYPNNTGFETSRTFIPMAKKKEPIMCGLGLWGSSFKDPGMDS
jgi:hypothetical protein